MSEITQVAQGGDGLAQSRGAPQEVYIADELKDKDEALTFLRKEEVGDESQYVDERALLRKIDWMVMPLMFCCYLLEYLDKSLCKCFRLEHWITA